MDYHHHRFDDFSLLVFKNKELVGILPANIVEDTIYSHQGLTYGGLITSKTIKLREYINCFKTILKYLKECNFKYIELKQLPSVYSVFPNDEFLYLMFILKADLIRRDTLSVINLKNKLKISKDRIAGNKRAIKHGLKIEEVNEFDEFWNQILIPNLKNKHNTQPVHSLEEIVFLKEIFPENIRQFNVCKGDNIVAGTTIFDSKLVAHSQYISANEDKNDLGSLDFLHLHLIENIFSDKKYFDFGISNEKQGGKINKGLNYWKEGFGARTVTQDLYRVDLNGIDKLENIYI